MLYKLHSLLHSGARTIIVLAFGLILFALSACTVQPLYSSGGHANIEGSVAAQLTTISVEEQTTREGQLVRNQLIFLLGRGAGQPANPQYTLDLSTTASASSAASVQRPQFSDDQPTAARVQMSGIYILKDAENLELIRGSRSAIASYDVPQQGFARDSATREAKERAARELAEQIYLAVAQALAKNK